MKVVRTLRYYYCTSLQYVADDIGARINYGRLPTDTIYVSGSPKELPWSTHLSEVDLICSNRGKGPATANMLVSMTVGKVDAGVAVLLTDDKRLVSSPKYFRSSTNTIASTSRSHGRMLIPLGRTDRISFNPASTKHFLGQYRRHHRFPQPPRRIESQGRVRHPTRQHQWALRPTSTFCSSPSLPQRHPDLCRPGMGPNQPCNGRMQGIELVPQWPEGWQYSEPTSHDQHQDQWSRR